MRGCIAKKYLLFCTIILLLCSTGCWDLNEIGEKAVTTAISMDLERNNKINFSALFISPSLPEETNGDSQNDPAITVATDYSTAIAARRTLLSLSKVPEYDHIRTIILGDELVKNGLPRVIDLLTRNPNFSPHISLLVSVGSRPEEILALINNTDRILKQLVAVSEFQLGIYVPVNLNDFIYKLLTPGIEPTIPQIMIETTIPESESASAPDKPVNPSGENKKLVLSSTAVFKKDKKIGELNEYESRGFRWLNSTKEIEGIISIKSPYNPDAYTVLEILRFSSNTKPVINENRIKMQIKINAHLALIENASGMETIKPTDLKKMEQSANQEIARQISSCIRKSQNLNSDILGWGLRLQQNQPDTWKQVKGDWDNIYPLVEYEIKVETSIIHTYLDK